MLEILMRSCPGLFLMCIATLFAAGDDVAAAPEVDFIANWKWPEGDPAPFVPWTISLTPDKFAQGGNKADIELQFSFEFIRDLLFTPTLDTGDLTPLSVINPYTGETTAGLSILQDVPSQLGREGNVNVMFLSFTGSDVSIKEKALRLAFTTDGGDGFFYDGNFLVGEKPHRVTDSFGVGSAYMKFPDGNIDGTINSRDIDEMILALGSNASWKTRHPGFDILEYLDGNLDGKVNNLDIHSYVGALSNPSFLVAANNSHVPEPTTSSFAAMSLLCAAGFIRRRLRAFTIPASPSK